MDMAGGKEHEKKRVAVRVLDRRVGIFKLRKSKSIRRRDSRRNDELSSDPIAVGMADND